MKKLKSYCLHKDITGKVTMQEPDNGEDGLYYNANDADAVIISQHEELERLRDAINKINDAGTYGSCENAITEAVALLPQPPKEQRK